MKLVSIMLVALMMLLTATMAANAEEHATEAVTAVAAVAEEHAAEAVTAAAAVAEEKVNESAVVAKEKLEQAATKAEEKVKETATEATKAAEKATPGFEGVFAIAGLLAVASLVLSRKE
jgi:hypothetical protein